MQWNPICIARTRKHPPASLSPREKPMLSRLPHADRSNLALRPQQLITRLTARANHGLKLRHALQFSIRSFHSASGSRDS